MKSSWLLFVSGGFLVVALATVETADAGACCRRAASDRGLAIASPLECPDPCPSPVGGCYRWTPYYPGYAPDRRCLILYGTSAWQCGGLTPALRNQPADFGSYTGASRDEAALLRLGGNGPGRNSTYRPYHGDLLDRIHGQP